MLPVRAKAAFVEIQQTFKRDGYNLRAAKAVHIEVDGRRSDEGGESFANILLVIEVPDLSVVYEIEFDNGMKLDGRWYFTNRIGEMRRITLL